MDSLPSPVRSPTPATEDKPGSAVTHHGEDEETSAKASKRTSTNWFELPPKKKKGSLGILPETGVAPPTPTYPKDCVVRGEQPSSTPASSKPPKETSVIAKVKGKVQRAMAALTPLSRGDKGPLKVVEAMHRLSGAPGRPLGYYAQLKKKGGIRLVKVEDQEG